MVLRTPMVLCVCVVCFVSVEARYHDVRELRKHRQQASDELPALLASDEDEYDEYVRHRRHRQYSSDEAFDEPADVDQAPEAEPTDVQDRAEYEDELPARRRAEHKRHRVSSSRRRHHPRHRKLDDYNDEELALGDALSREAGGSREQPRRNHRGKRHNRRRNWTEKDKKAFNSSRRPELYDHDINVFEVEVREAQNSSLCNYTVIPIPDPGGRVPGELEHVKCNYVGNRCGDQGSYCCIQTYRLVEVSYPGGRNDTIKVYSGCVCSLQIYGTLKPYYPKLELDD